ncbi:MAG: hypothetical protein WB610_12695, partial [Rhodomicrobium sp.]
AEAFAGPERERLLDGARQLLVRVRLFNSRCVTDDGSQPWLLPDAYTDLRPEQARQLALQLLQAADDAERQTLAAEWWQQAKRIGGSR